MSVDPVRCIQCGSITDLPSIDPDRARCVRCVNAEIFKVSSAAIVEPCGPATDRIASALERIATALERYAGGKP